MLYAILGMLVLLSGCMSSSVTYENGLRIRTVGETNLLRPSITVLEVSECVEVEGRTETNNSETCYGTYRPIGDVVYGTQTGALSGLGAAVVQGGAMVGSAYLLGDGIRDSASTVSQNGGGASSNSKAGAKSSSRSSAKQAQFQKQSQSQRGTNSQINNPMSMMPRGD